MDQIAQQGDQEQEAIGDVMERIATMTMRDIMEPINIQRRKEYIDRCTDEEAKALAATTHRGANDVLTVRPNRVETTLNDWELKFALHQRFGLLDKLLDVQDGNPNCKACSAPDLTGAHFLSCGHSRKQRHDEVVIAHLRALLLC